MDSTARQFAQRFADYERRLARLERGARVSRLAHASLEDTSIPAYDDTGTVRQIIGRQSDGTFAVAYVNGPPPPRPSAPTVSARQLAIVVGWDGEFEDGAPRPGDFARVDVHMDTDPEFEPTGATVYGSLVGEGALAIPADTETHYVRLVAVTLSDVASTPTDPVEVEALPASEISSEFVYAGEVSADQITAGTLRADVNLASTIRTGETGARVELSNEGLVSYDTDGEVSVVMPTDPESDASFAGSIVAGGLTVTGSAAFRSTGNEISKGGNLLLQSATTAPQNAPSAVVGWEFETMANGTAYRGLVHHNGKLWAGRINAPEIVAQDGETVTLQVAWNGTPPLHPTGGITRVGSHWYILGREAGTGDWYISKCNDSGEDVGRTYWGTSQIPYEQYPCIGTDGTNLLIAQFDPTADRFYIQTRDAGSLAWVAAFPTASNPGFSGPAVGVARGQFDIGVDLFVILSQHGNNYWTYRPGGSYDPDFVWPSPFMGSAGGFAWDGTRFWCVENVAAYSSNRLAKHSTVKWVGPSSRTYHAALTWRNSVEGYETDAGRVGSFSMRKRAWVTLTAPEIPDGGNPEDPDSVAFYLSQATTPSRTNLFLQTLPPVGARSVTLGDTITFTGTNPPASSNFPGSTPGTITNADRSLVVSGNGTIQATSVDAAFPGIRMAIKQLPDGFVLPAGHSGEWVNWGSPLALANPGRFVGILATGTASAVNDGTAAYVGMRLGISLDGGATWTYGSGPRDQAGAGSATRRASVACQHLTLGATTGDVLVQAQVQATNDDPVLWFGAVTYLLVPTLDPAQPLESTP